MSDGIEIEGTLDAYVDLVDRQVISADGFNVSKVDDLELEERDGDLLVTGLLVGPGALGPRLGGFLEYATVGLWSRLARRDRDDPRRIDWTHVRRVATVLEVDRWRRDIGLDGLETWVRVRLVDALPGAGNDPDASLSSHDEGDLPDGPPREGPRHTVGRLGGMRVRFADGVDGDQVTDLRLERAERRGHLPVLRSSGLLVGRNRPGTTFGYDRDAQKGPWLVRAVLRRVHRHTAFVAWSDVDHVDWDAGVVVLRVTADQVRPLSE